MRVKRLDHILIAVTDIERAARFYGALGLERVPSISNGITWLRLENGQALHLWRRDEGGPYAGWQHEPSPHFALEVDDPRAFVAIIEKAGGRLLSQVATRPHNGHEFFFALDPDGNRFEITGLARSEELDAAP